MMTTIDDLDTIVGGVTCRGVSLSFGDFFLCLGQAEP